MVDSCQVCNFPGLSSGDSTEWPLFPPCSYRWDETQWQHSRTQPH